MKIDKESLYAEELNLQRLKNIVDLTAALILQSNLTLLDAQKLVDDARVRALELFPEKSETFDLIYGARFHRILVERYRLQ
ncbi:MAG: hypothetical protein IH919_11410 [Deltaproteobacteria bacterium]|jgi:hypothetical protein|nr:hypothetical protein [Deltaproteobacteria bacterium]MCH7913691.1 hypothetical protein [Deltaproteobacteria bacterium]MCZ6450482.1 hypothetical protein [Deltaproteobacteria bacterium]MCZ6547671.1 hypothetical protein [Deltaproteobacteria bacterium]